MAKFICTVCGYVHEGDTPPEKCPVCNVGPDKFKKQEESMSSAAVVNNQVGNEGNITKFVCTVCGYVHEGDAPPEKCPICSVGPDKFIKQESTPVSVTNWADEHRIGVAKGVDQEVIEGLRAHFTGECTEVGMYIAMSRQADREGFPEVAETYRRIAFEEAEHAAKFAELLGEVVTDSTKKNLELRIEAEKGACEGKLQIAKRAKELGYDAIHDTVHEMCKDEARHGSAFSGLLKRYF